MRYLLVALLCALSYAQTAWKVCYTDSDNRVLMNSQTSSTITEPDAVGYRADCSGVTFNQVRYVNLETNEVACFTRNSDSVTLGSNWFFNDAEEWTSNAAGVATTDYSYQLNVCSNGWMETGLMITGITNGCRKGCNNWCGDTTSPYFRMDGDDGGSYNGVAFNEPGHTNVNTKLMQVSVRQGSDTDCISDENQRYSYSGCYSSGWDRSVTQDVPINAGGVITCRDYCNDAGYSYFGFECPHDGGAEVHCECSNSVNAAESVSDESCQQIGGVANTHCVGPFVVETDFGTYMMGAHGLNSAYLASPSTPKYEYQGCYSTSWDRSNTADVPLTEDGVQQCRDSCANAGNTYFGFECPHDNGAEVHCECSNGITENDRLADDQCQTNIVSGSHCSGPYSVITSHGTYYMGSHGTNTGYAVEAMEFTTTTTTTTPAITMEQCRDDTSTLPISQVTGDGTVIQGDTVSVHVDYPGYMTLLAIEFIGDEASPFLDTWTIESTDLCRGDNSVSQDFNYGQIADNYEITRNGEHAEFSILAEFMYYTRSDVTQAAESITVQKEIKFRITAPQTVVVSVTANFQPGSALIYDIMSHGVVEENGVSLIQIEFRTFIGAGHSLTGDCSIMSTYFTGITECSTTPAEAFTHPTEGDGTLQTWTIRAQNPNQCVEGEHTESIEVDLSTESGFTERIEFLIDMIDELGPDCGVVIGEFDMTTSVQVSDGNVWLDSSNLDSAVFYLESVMYFMVDFESYMEPSTVDITALAITQNEDVKCGGDCLDSVELVCDSCDENGVSAGGVYNFSIVLTSANGLFEAQPGVNTPTVIDMTFGLSYSRRQLTKVSDVFSAPVSFALRDYECHAPNGLLTDVETVGCDLSSMTKSMICSRGGWKEISQCAGSSPMISLSITNFVALISTIVFSVAVLSRIAFPKAKPYTPVPLEESKI